MNCGDHADEEVEADAIARLQSGREHFGADARNPQLAAGFVRECVMHVVRELAVNADWLHSMEHGVARSLEHEGYGLQVTGLGGVTYSRNGSG